MLLSLLSLLFLKIFHGGGFHEGRLAQHLSLADYKTKQHFKDLPQLAT